MSLQGNIIHSYGKGEAGLARYIASRKEFYKKVNGLFIPLSVSSITTYLRDQKRDVSVQIAEEERAKTKTKRKGTTHP